jgi:hypothetical protein
VVRLHRHAALLSLMLTGCGTPRLPLDSQGDESSGSTSSTESESSTSEATFSVTFVPSNDHEVIPSCNEFTQDCPDGEKCVPYASHGNNWDAFKCVPVMGDQATGEPCTYGGITEATDDCDELSGCWNVRDVEGAALGTCHAFCMGTADDPVCPEGSSCTLSGSGVPAYCIPICDPVAQDCGPGLGCYFGGSGFQCAFSLQNIPAGDPCGYINDCAPGLLCLNGEVLPACNGSACCVLFCNLDLGDAQCSATPGTTCQPYYENNTAPPGFEHVGICIVPAP